jgi:hypothetical protein
MNDLVVLKNQWQAQPVAQPPEAADVAVLLGGVSVLPLEPELADVLSLALAASAAPVAAAGTEVPPEPPLKSVAYQPEPLS